MKKVLEEYGSAIECNIWYDLHGNIPPYLRFCIAKYENANNINPLYGYMWKIYSEK